MKQREWMKTCLVVGLLVVFAAVGLWYYFRPLSTAVTVEYLQQYYQNISKDFSFEQWERTRMEPEGELLLEIEPQEELVLRFYTDNRVVVSDGYAMPIFDEAVAIYNIPEDAVAAFIDHYQ